MRQTRKSQLALGEARIEDIKLDHKSRDDIPAVLLGLQHLYSHKQTRDKLFSLLEEHILPGTNRNVGRPGMELWRVLVMGVLKQGLGGCRSETAPSSGPLTRKRHHVVGNVDFSPVGP